ncbi:hypothetical protein OG21DRAFT_1526743 [Imleria badia]|nr:hypothetical protein OG21DRAFT_1526743 [Imleria badia]
MRIFSSLVSLALYFRFSTAAPVIPRVGDITTRDKAGSQGHAGTDVPAIGNFGNRERRRCLADVLAPLLETLSPTLDGLDAGLQQGAGNVKAAEQNIGAALNQAVNGVADIGAITSAGLGQTVGQAPAAVVGTVHAIDQTLFGQ